MGALEVLIHDIIRDSGLDSSHIRTRTSLELPGYFRPEKKWDLLVVVDQQLVAAMEFKSQVGPSFGNNFNNRCEEAVGSANDIWTAYREGRFGTAPRPFLGYFFLLEDCPAVHKPVRSAQPYFKIDPIFEDASYSKRYEIMCRRLVLERFYNSACLTLSTNDEPSTISHPANDLSFERLASSIQAHVSQFV